MSKLRELYAKDINREIQGVIKVDDETFIKQELEEYVVTDELLKHFRNFFDSYNASITGNTEKMGVWISGFFGSGKSHFLKILSYILDNKVVDGKPAVDYFDDKIQDQMLLANMKRAGNVPTDVILFNIDSKASLDNLDGKDKILSVFEKVFNEKQGLSTIPHVAELERFLIKNNKYEEFKEAVSKECGEDWETARNDFYFRRDEIVNAYSKVMNKSHEEAENWFDKAEENYDISIEKFAKRIKEYIEANDKKHVVFLVDEVGQYAGTDSKALLNLQTMVENLGLECGGKAWVCVTSQEAIDEVVKVHSDNFSKIQGRFDTKLSLSSSDTDEVIKKRILAKTDSATDSLESLYEQKESIIKNLFVWSKNTQTQKEYLDKKDFAMTYPFVPYQFNLLQKVFTDIRTQGFAGKHLSSGERSLLGAFQETAKRYEDSEVGVLIPFYAFYDTIEQFLEGTIKRVFQNANDIMNAGNLKEMDINVLKILFMLKSVKEIPTNVDNIALLYASSIDEDKLKLKQDISASLKRLENETLIQRNNEEYKFLTDDEQEINREIKKVVVDQTKINEYLKGLIFDYTLTDRKFTYRNNPFDLSLYLDNMKVSAREYEIGIKVVTTSVDKDDSEVIRNSSFDQNNIYVLLDIPTNVYDEMYNCLQVEEYVRNTSRIAKSQNVDDIIRTKSREAENTKSRIRESIADSLKESDILINGDKQIINAKEPRARINEALEKLVKNTYNKIDYIKANFTSTDIRTLFHEDKNHLVGTEVEFPNKKALDELKDYLTEKKSFSFAVTIRSVLQDFEKAPYGYMEQDIIYLLTRLLKDEYINLVYGNEIQSPTSEDTLTKLLRRDYYDKTVIKIREKIAIGLVNDVKLVARNCFDKMLPDNEDGMFADLKEAINSKLMELNQKQGLYSINRQYNYPGEEVINETITLLSDLSKIRDINDFFENVSNNRQILESNMEKVSTVLDFFNGKQKENFDNARKAVMFYEDNKDYADEIDELKDAVRAITSILELEEPYSEIPKLPGLRDNLNNILTEMYDKKSVPIVELAKNTITYIDNEVSNSEVDKSFGEGIKTQLTNIIKSIETSNELKDIFAKETYINQLRDRFNNDLDREKTRLLQKEEPTGEVEIVINRKTIKVNELLNRSYDISNKEDVEKYLEELRKKILEALEENKNLTIR